ncbi:hypothetical protein HII28_19480 [Planctomonas sp. JC2975]|uniref:hypothetical protein n=1 Tax=Planctomonas sp. JC2975 TaxID=2729626 RepID=UPI001472A220|nr:hypothetical protein [Planctomonas sp. JC2975]NNC14045.1 hypothetical protein [Planctomonas sp. JC2975]
MLLTLVTVTPAHADSPTSASDAVYQLDVNGQQTTLAEGESAVYPIVAVDSPAAEGLVPLSTSVPYPGDIGLLTVSAAKGVYHYDIAMSEPSTNFVGDFCITDLTSGFSNGCTHELIFSADIPTSKLRGHTYSGTLSGTAYFLGLPNGNTVPNNTIYTYNDY